MGHNLSQIFKEKIFAEAGFPNIPETWAIIQVDEILSQDRGISVGVMYPGKHDPFGIPLIKVSDLNDHFINFNPDFRITTEKHHEYRRTALEGGEILLTLVGDVGRCAVAPPKIIGWNVARAIAVIRLKDPKNVHFVKHCLRSKYLQHIMQIWSNTTVQVTLNLKEIKQLPLPWPPSTERDAISEILDALDDKIELNQQMNKTLETIAQAIFKSWFIDFDPVRAKMEGREPYGMDAETAALFPDGFEDSEFGEIPRGWQVKQLGNLVVINNRNITKDFKHKTIQYIEISSVTKGTLEDITYCPLGDAPSRAKRLVTDGDTIWSTVRPNRQSYLFIQNPEDNLVVSTGFIVLTPSRIPPCYLYEWVTTNQFVDYLAYNADGSAYPAVSPGRFQEAKMLLPDSRILQSFENSVNPLRRLIASLNEENRLLSTLRDTLLPKLISGQIRVKEAEKMAEVQL